MLSEIKPSASDDNKPLELHLTNATTGEKMTHNALPSKLLDEVVHTGLNLPDFYPIMVFMGDWQLDLKASLEENGVADGARLTVQVAYRQVLREECQKEINKITEEIKKNRDEESKKLIHVNKTSKNLDEKQISGIKKEIISDHSKIYKLLDEKRKKLYKELKELTERCSPGTCDMVGVRAGDSAHAVRTCTKCGYQKWETLGGGRKRRKSKRKTKRKRKTKTKKMRKKKHRRKKTRKYK